MKFIVQIYFDIERPTTPTSLEWVQARYEVFKQTTLKSLLGQSFQDFTVWLMCGDKHCAFTETMELPDKVVRIYGNEAEAVASVADDYLSITRIDSDDLMHKRGMLEISEIAPKHAKPDRRACLIWRKNLFWNRNNGCIGYHYRESPPFFTHIFPKAIYRKWKQFYGLHHLEHGRAGGKSSGTVELSKHRICIVKHGSNYSDVRRNRTAAMLTQQQKDRCLQKGSLITTDPPKMLEILAAFGVISLDVGQNNGS